MKIQMLGAFTLSKGDVTVQDQDNRSRKVWLVLAYLLYFRNRGIPAQELIERNWDGDRTGADPVNALKAVMYRLRTMLDKFGSGTGKTLVLHSDGKYRWAASPYVTVDIDEFERLRRLFSAERQPEQKLEYGLQAAALYHGDFLEKFKEEHWILPVATYFHNTYVQLIKDCLELLHGFARYEEAAALAKQAIAFEPGDEDLYSAWMTALMELGDAQEVRAVYNTMSSELFSRLGNMPSEEIRDLYHKANRPVNEQEIDLSSVMGDLQEDEQVGGAYFCEYDFFKVLYHVRVRSLSRSGEVAQMCLISVSGIEGKPMSRKSLDLCMQNLRHVIVASLRKGDLVSQCSPSQYILLLANVDYANTNKIVERVERTFLKQYPHTPALLHCSIHPLSSV